MFVWVKNWKKKHTSVKTVEKLLKFQMEKFLHVVINQWRNYLSIYVLSQLMQNMHGQWKMKMPVMMDAQDDNGLKISKK